MTVKCIGKLCLFVFTKSVQVDRSLSFSSVLHITFSIHERYLKTDCEMRRSIYQNAKQFTSRKISVLFIVADLVKRICLFGETYIFRDNHFSYLYSSGFHHEITSPLTLDPSYFKIKVSRLASTFKKQRIHFCSII